MNPDSSRTAGDVERVLRALDERRRELQLSKADLADIVGADASTIRRLLSGHGRNPTVATVAALAAGLGLHLVAVPADSPVQDSAGLTISAAADYMRQADTDAVRLRVFFEFIRYIAEEPSADVARLVAGEPRSTGDDRFDALLAAAAEHVTSRAGLPAPWWCQDPNRVLHRAWWIDDLPSSRAFAVVHTPASFHKRGIYLDAHDLESA